MTKTFYFVRHGESQSNAGEKTSHPVVTRLTQKGHLQAKEAALSFPAKPDILITSRYLRTKQTADPFLERFENIAQAEWNIHEFTYLLTSRYKDTTNAERRPFILKYWESADPLYKEDESAESFAEFVGRCRETVGLMKDYKGSLALAFSHGYLMKGILFCLQGRFDRMDPDTMRDFWSYHKNYVVGNCSRLKFEIAHGGTIELKESDITKRNRDPEVMID